MGCGSLFCRVRGEHDDRKGHHYYTRLHQPAEALYSSDDPCGHHALQKMPLILVYVSV